MRFLSNFMHWIHNSNVSIHTYKYSMVASSCFRGITRRLPNLTDVEFGFWSERGNQIALQQNLEKVLCIWAVYGICNIYVAYIDFIKCRRAQLLADWLADNNVPIEDLKICGYNPRVVDGVGRLTTIQS